MWRRCALLVRLALRLTRMMVVMMVVVGFVVVVLVVLVVAVVLSLATFLFAVARRARVEIVRVACGARRLYQRRRAAAAAAAAAAANALAGASLARVRAMRVMTAVMRAR